MDSPIKTLRNFLIALGTALLLAGGVLLLWFGQMVYQIVTEPEGVRIVQYIAEHIPTDGPIISGSAAEAEFEVTLSESARAFGFFLLGIFALGVLAGILKALLAGGVGIIKGALAVQATPDGNEASKGSQRVFPTQKR